MIFIYDSEIGYIDKPRNMRCSFLDSSIISALGFELF